MQVKDRRAINAIPRDVIYHEPCSRKGDMKGDYTCKYKVGPAAFFGQGEADNTAAKEQIAGEKNRNH